MPPNIFPQLRTLQPPLSLKTRMARAVARFALVPRNSVRVPNLAGASFFPHSELGSVPYANGFDALASSLFCRRFHALCGEERRALRPLGRVFAAQRDYRKARRRAFKSKEKELELNVSICIEEGLPEDPEVLVGCCSVLLFFPRKLQCAHHMYAIMF